MECHNKLSKAYNMEKDAHRLHRNKIVNYVVLPSRNPDLFMDAYDIRAMKENFKKKLYLDIENRMLSRANEDDSNNSESEEEKSIANAKMMTEEFYTQINHQASIVDTPD